MELKRLCEEYLENYEYCEKLQYLSKYDERLYKEWLDGWVESVRIRERMYDELSVMRKGYDKLDVLGVQYDAELERKAKLKKDEEDDGDDS